MQLPEASCRDVYRDVQLAGLHGGGHGTMGLARLARLLVGASSWKSRRLSMSAWSRDRLKRSQIMYVLLAGWGFMLISSIRRRYRVLISVHRLALGVLFYRFKYVVV